MTLKHPTLMCVLPTLTTKSQRAKSLSLWSVTPILWIRQAHKLFLAGLDWSELQSHEESQGEKNLARYMTSA